jgi:hypothetical protein
MLLVMKHWKATEQDIEVVKLKLKMVSLVKIGLNKVHRSMISRLIRVQALVIIIFAEIQMDYVQYF